MVDTVIHMDMAMAGVVILMIMMLPRSVRRTDRSAGKTDRIVRLFPDHQEAWVVPPAHK